MTAARRVVAFGEVMLRLSPPGYRRLTQATTLEMHFGGAEANVAVALAQLGVGAAYVTRLPAGNELAEACLAQMRGFGVDVSGVVFGGSRMGLYFVEHGAGLRPASVLYDRAHSALAEIDPAELDWDALLNGAEALHVTGITPAVSEGAARATLDGVRAAREKGLLVTCDLNYRAKLWSAEAAGRTMTEIIPYVDTFSVGAGEAAALFGITVEAGSDDPRARHAALARALIRRFPNLKRVAATMRDGDSPSRDAWAGLLYLAEDDAAYVSRRYEFEIVDRLGGGDAFTAGLLYGMLDLWEPQATIDFAAAAGALKHSVPGDFHSVRLSEVEALLAGGASGRVLR